ncbi:MAG TPA: response regulator, partial [Gemmatimonadaceae bacterium]|nr:response regulator [Gemmatimonadaceae bacterium]
MSVPLRAPERLEPNLQSPKMVLGGAEVSRESRILIIDDRQANIELLRRILHNAGFVSVNCTTDPRTGVELVQTWDPDLVLLDLQMPGLDGFGVLEAIRPQLTDGSYLPVLMLTADSSAETKRRALASGVKD